MNIYTYKLILITMLNVLRQKQEGGTCFSKWRKNNIIGLEIFLNIAMLTCLYGWMDGVQ